MQQAAFPIGLHAGSHTHTPLLFSYVGVVFYRLLHRSHFGSQVLVAQAQVTRRSSSEAPPPLKGFQYFGPLRVFFSPNFA